MIRYCLPFLFSMIALLIQAQPSEEKKRRIIALPVAFYQPETSLGFGGIAMSYFRLDTFPESRPSSVQSVLLYTLNKQVIAELPFTLFLKNDTYWLSIVPAFNIFPFQYYGQGGKVDLNTYDSYDATSSLFRMYLRKRIKPGLYIGPRFQILSYHSMKTTTDENLLDETIRGYGSSRITGLGMGVIFDRRNNLFSPDEGWYTELMLMTYSGVFGSNYSFTDVTLDVRNYVDVGEKSEFAIQTYHQFQVGAVPFYSLAQLGGDDRMRGYFEGAYRNKHYTMVQTEFRRYITKWIIASSFVGVGAIGSEASQYGDILVSGGLGLRFEIDPKEKVRLRVDYAIGKNSDGLYFSINEAF